jgi:glycosyltransferase involved in cell wall biosynthesis
VKVLHVGEYVNGGVATYIKEVLEYQEKSTDISELNLLLSKNKSDIEIALDKGNVYKYDYKRSIGGFFKAISFINNSINNIQPDIIHVHSTFAGFLTRLLFFFKKQKVKIVYCPHGWSFLMEIGIIKRWIFAFVERILAIKTNVIVNISNFELEKSIEYGLSAKKSVVIYNGISEKSTSMKKSTLTINKKFINILFVGRYDKQKGLDILLDLFAKNHFENIRLYIIGGSVLEDIELKIPQNVIEIGWIDNKDIDYYYQQFDAIIVPSRWEGFGIVAIEAMKNKKAVIVSNRGALPEIVINNENGYVFSLDNKEELVYILQNLNKEDLVNMGKKGYDLFKNNFQSEHMNESILKLYKKILK